MPLFNENNPESQFMIDPTYLPDDKKFLAATMGFKQTGERNDFGKVIRWIPGMGNSTRKNAHRTFGDLHADTFMQNVDENKGSDSAAGAAGAGFGLALAGGVSEIFAPGNPLGLQAIQQGAKMGISGAAGVGNDVNLADDWGSSFHPMARGGEMSNWWEGSEDLAMIDKKTGVHAGDISYGERVMSKEDNEEMKRLKAKKDWLGLGKFVAKAMAAQPDFSKGEGQLKKGGVLTPERAKEILKQGKVYGRPFTEKQRKYFERVAAGTVPQYRGGGPIAKAPIVVTNPNDPKLQAYKDSMYLHDRSMLLDKYYAKNGINPDMLDSNYVNPVAALSDLAPFLRLNFPAPETTKMLPIVGSEERIPYPIYKRPTQPVMLKTELKKGGEVPHYADGAEIFKNLGNSLGGPEQLFNLAQFLIGSAGSKSELPGFKKPEAWDQFLLEQRRAATQGFSGEERGAVQRGNERALTAGLNFAHEASGGNSAFAVGDASRFAGDYMDRGLKFASANEEMKRRSQERYGQTLLQDIAFDKEDWARRYDETLRKNTAAGDLAHTGLQSIINQVDYNKNFGPGSINEQYMQSLIDMNKKLGGMDITTWLKNLMPTAATVPGAAPVVNPGVKSTPWYMEEDYMNAPDK